MAFFSLFRLRRLLKQSQNVAALVRTLVRMSERNKKIKRSAAVINMAGLPESGKTTLLDRLLDKPVVDNLVSTELCKPTIIVDVNPKTLSSVANLKEEDDSWVQTWCKDSFITQLDSVMNSSEGMPLSTDDNMLTPQLYKDVSDVLNFHHIEDIEDLGTIASLYIRDVGGHIEFQGSLSLLVYGPAIFLFVFNACVDIESKQTIRYRMKGGDINCYESSISTKDALLQCLSSVCALQITDSTIQPSRVAEGPDEVCHKPRVFIVGTHMDIHNDSKLTSIKQKLDVLELSNISKVLEELDEICLISEKSKLVVEELSRELHNCLDRRLLTPEFYTAKNKFEDIIPSIEKINEKLHHVIHENGFQDLIEYKNVNKNKVMFPVNNKSSSDKNIKKLKAKIGEYILNIENGFVRKYDVSYILFALDFLRIQEEVTTFEECKRIAMKYGIQDVAALLNFFHLQVGTLQWFDIDHLRNWVIIEPQFIFGVVHEIIVKTFIDSKTKDRDHERQLREKGIFDKMYLLQILEKKDCRLKSNEFLDFLIHLRMVVRYMDKGGKEKYFFPSVLNHSQLSSTSADSIVSPMFVTFKCGHCPKGIFGVLVTYLMEHKKGSEEPLLFMLEDQIFRDEISFDVRTHGDTDMVTVKMHASHLEFNFYPQHLHANVSRNCSVGYACNSIRFIIEKYLKLSLKSLHYSEHLAEPEVSFRCPECSLIHGVVPGTKGHHMNCKMEGRNKLIPLPENTKFWYNEAPDIQLEDREYQAHESSAGVKRRKTQAHESSAGVKRRKTRAHESSAGVKRRRTQAHESSAGVKQRKTIKYFQESTDFLPDQKATTEATTELAIGDLAEVQRECFGARTKWYNMGLVLGLAPDSLDAIKHDDKDSDSCFRNMLKKWLQSGSNRQWKTLAEALKSQVVGRQDVSADIIKKFCQK